MLGGGLLESDPRAAVFGSSLCPTLVYIHYFTIKAGGAGGIWKCILAKLYKPKVTKLTDTVRTYKRDDDTTKSHTPNHASRFGNSAPTAHTFAVRASAPTGRRVRCVRYPPLRHASSCRAGPSGDRTIAHAVCYFYFCSTRDPFLGPFSSTPYRQSHQCHLNAPAASSERVHSRVGG